MSKLLLVFTLFVILNQINCDLPIHCLKHQVTGKWNFEFTSALIQGDGQLSCGHEQPDNQDSSWSAMEEGFIVDKELSFNLNSFDKVMDSQGHQAGGWTMIYDEGFEIVYKEFQIFTFNKYQRKDNYEYESICGETLVGWYKNTQTSERGCCRGFKVDSERKASENIEQGHVVEPEKREFIFAQGATDVGKQSISHSEIVSKLNLIQKSWTAKVPEEFEGLTVGQMNQRAGQKRFSSPEQKKASNLGFSFLQTTYELDSENNSNNNNNKKYIHYSREDVSDLPKEFSWEDYLNDPVSQKDCGSCYAIATMEMLSARINIKYNDPVQLSAQESIDCNYYNQGCDGGYGFLVSKYYTENELVSEQCYPYKAKNGNCQAARCENKNLRKYKVSDYRYLGGAYGKSSERLMMTEIQENGPIVVSFEPGMDFMYYHSGVYHSVDAEGWIKSGLGQPEWEKVDHSVLCYGWGETAEGEKYWKVLNSWGTNWGEDGKFRIRRGTDESHIESMGEAANIVQLSSVTKKSFLQTGQNKNHSKLKKNS